MVEAAAADRRDEVSRLQPGFGASAAGHFSGCSQAISYITEDGQKSKNLPQNQKYPTTEGLHSEPFLHS